MRIGAKRTRDRLDGNGARENHAAEYSNRHVDALGGSWGMPNRTESARQTRQAAALSPSAGHFRRFNPAAGRRKLRPVGETAGGSRDGGHRECRCQLRHRRCAGRALHGALHATSPDRAQRPAPQRPAADGQPHDPAARGLSEDLGAGCGAVSRSRALHGVRVALDAPARDRLRARAMRTQARSRVRDHVDADGDRRMWRSTSASSSA